MKKIALLALTAAASAVLFAPSAKAATSTDTVTINSTIPDTVVLNITESSVNIDFTAAQLGGGTTSASAAGAINGNIKANRPVALSVVAEAGDSKATKLDPSDISLKVSSGGTGSTVAGGFGSFTPLSTASQNLATYTTPGLTSGSTFALDAQVNNANTYAGKATAYTNVLTFTATTS